jgi:hypothetical protein
LTDEESEMLARILEYGIKEEQKEIVLLSGPGGNKDFIPNCNSRLELLKSVAQARVGAA